jgi:hypothetical protein
MPRKSFESELQRALARTDVEKLVRQIDAYIECDRSGGVNRPDDIADDLEEVLMSGDDDPDKALAYVVIAAARTDDAGFLAFMGAGPLENALQNPSCEFLDRVVAEARRTPRFRWLLSVPFKVAVAEAAWDAIKPFRITGDHEESTAETLRRGRSSNHTSSTSRP